MKRSSILDCSIATQVFKRALVFGFGFAVAGVAQTAHAQKVWNGPSGENLATAANWVGGTVPVDGDILRWNGTVTGPLSLTSTLAITNGVFLEIKAGQTDSLTIDPTSFLRLRDITIEAGAGAFSLGDGVGALNSAPLTLGSGSFATNTFTNNSSNTATINSDVQFANGGAVANRTLVLTGTGNWTVNTTLAPSGAGTTNLTKSGTGTLNVGNANALGVTGRTFTITAGSLDNITGAALTTSNVVQVWNGDFAFGGTNALNLGTGTVSLGTTAGTSRTITTNGSALLTVGGVVSNGTTVNSLIKAGPGSLRLDGANTYSGGTTLLEGQLHVGNNSALGTGTLTINSGTIVPRGASRTLANAVAVGGDFVVGDNVGLNNALTLSGAVDLGGATRTVTVLNYVVAGDGLDTTWSGAISNGALTKAGAGTLVLTGNSSFNGATTVTEGTVLLSGTGAINGSSGIIINSSSAKFVQTSSVASTPTITLTEGTLDGTGTVGAVNVAASDFAILTNGNGGTASLTTGNLSFAGAATVNVASNGTNAGIVAGTLTTSGVNGAITLNINRTGTWNNGVNNLISYASFVSADINDFALGNIVGPNLGARQAIGGLVLNGNSIALQIIGTSVYWTGLQSNQWTTNTGGGGQNWKKTSDNLGTDFLSGDDVVFNDAPGTNQTIQINDGDVSTTTMVFNNSAVSYTLTSSGGFGINSGSLTKNGTGTVTLATANTYSDGTTLNAGKLNVNHELALGFGTVAINGGTLDNTSGSPITLTSSSAQNWSGDFAFAGTNSLDMGMGAVTLGGVGNRTITVSANTFAAGELKSAATQGLIKQGAGTLVLGSTGTGNAGSVLGGTLEMAAGTLQINRTEDFAGGDLTVAGLTGNGTITNGAAVERSLIVNTTGIHTFSGSLANGGTAPLGLSKQGTGTLILTGSSSYTGTTTVGGGILNVQNSNALGLSNVVNQAAGARNSGIQLQGNISLPSAVSFVLSNDGGLQGTATVPYAISNVSGNNTINGAINLTTGGGGSVIQSDSGVLTLAGTISPTLNIGARALILQGASTEANTVSGVIQNNTGASDVMSVTKTGTGTWTLSGNNTYTGGTTVSAGTLNATSDSALGSTAGGLSLTPASGTATVNFTSAAPAIGSLASSGTGTSSVVLGNATIPAATVLTVGGNNTSTTFAGTISDLSGTNATASGSLTKIGTGTLSLSSFFSTYTGGTTLNAGTIEVGASSTPTSGTVTSGPLGTGTLTINGGALTARGANRTLANAVIVGGDFTLNGALGGGNTLTLSGKVDFGGATRTIAVDATTGAAVIAGVISNGGLTKTGTRTLTLFGANTYTGPTTIAVGTLAVSGSISASTSITVKSGATLDVSAAGMSLASGQTLGGNGTVVGLLSMSGGSKLAPGDSTGTLTFANNLDISLAVTPAASAALKFDLGFAASDKVQLTLGTLSIGSDVLGFSDFAFTNLGDLASGTYTLFDTSAAINGTLDLNDLTGSLGAGFTGTLGISGDGQDLVLTVIPEPGSATLLLTGLGSILGLRRFRRRSI